MFVELLITCSAAQRELIKAYEATDRLREVGLYVLAQQISSLAYFQQFEPPHACRALYQAFMNWQHLGIETLAAELDSNQAVDPKLIQEYEDSAEQFAAEMDGLKKASEAAR
jgi:hypothetical protein